MVDGKKTRKYLIAFADESLRQWKYLFEKVCGKFQYNKKHEAYQFYTVKNLDEILDDIKHITSKDVTITRTWVNDSTYWSGVFKITIGKNFVLMNTLDQKIKNMDEKWSIFYENAADGYDKGWYAGKAEAYEEILDMLKK